MNLRTGVISIAMLILLSVFANAQDELSSINKQELFQELTSNPRSTWIKAGTIKAVYDKYQAPKTTDEKEILSEISTRVKEYQANENKAEIADSLQKMAIDAIPFNVRYHLSNEYTSKTKTFLKYDGKRFYYDMKVESRKDSVLVPDELKGNFKTEEFNMDWNGWRILCFDGEKYTMYTPGINHAIIEPMDNMPNGSISLLSRGIIPWGYGSFSYDSITKSESSVSEKVVDGRTEIHLKIINKTGSESLIVLDPARSYAPLSWIYNKNDSSTIHLYSGYKLVADSWVPTSITIEKFDKSTGKLLEGDYTTIEEINGETPKSTDFVVDFTPNTLIEHTYDITKPQLSYFYSEAANSDLLLTERIAYVESEDKRIQNCATSTLQYAALQLGKDILNQELSEIVNLEDMTTSMTDMKKYAESNGLYCKAVVTDIDTLKGLSNCKAILHIPGKKHFILLDHIDDNYVWIIDLTEDNFYYRNSISFFDMGWTEGTALLISNEPIILPEKTFEIPDDYLPGFVGGSGYTCTDLIQSTTIIHCMAIELNCMGYYQLIYRRYGCEGAESGTCTDEYKTEKMVWPCLNREGEVFTGCTVDLDEQQFYYILACK